VSIDISASGLDVGTTATTVDTAKLGALIRSCAHSM
jgi:hypothetical protein